MPDNAGDFRSRILAQKTVWAAGCYDVFSAKMIAEAGFEAVFTSGFGISGSFLGQPDAELYTMTENLEVTRNVIAAVDIPVVADIDTGYGNAINVIRTVRAFEAAGARAIILEDQISPKRCPACTDQIGTISIDEACAKIEAAVFARRNPEMVIIGRTDATDGAEAMARGRAYVKAGADIIQPISRTFTNFSELRAFRQGCGVPLSLQLLGWLERDLAPGEIESIAGVATFPLLPFMTVAAALKENLGALARTKTSKGLPRPVMDHNLFAGVIGFPEIEKLQARFLRAAPVR